MKARLDLHDDIGDETMNIGTPKTTKKKVQQEYRLVELYGSERQKKSLANVRQSKVDVKDLDSSMNSTLAVVDV